MQALIDVAINHIRQEVALFVGNQVPASSGDGTITR